VPNGACTLRPHSDPAAHVAYVRATASSSLKMESASRALEFALAHVTGRIRSSPRPFDVCESLSGLRPSRAGASVDSPSTLREGIESRSLASVEAFTVTQLRGTELWPAPLWALRRSFS
jgi:hypothetical protein